MNQPALARDARPSPPKPRPPRAVCRLRGAIAAYLVLGAAWILLSDRMLMALSPDIGALAAIGAWKGLAFLAISGLGLYLALSSLARRADTLGAAPDADDGAAAMADAVHPRALVVVLMVLAAVILGAGLASVAASATDVREARRSALVSSLEYKAAQVRAWRESRLDEARLLAGDPSLADAVSDWRRRGDRAAREAVRGQLRTLALTADHAEALLVDMRGRVLMTTDRTGAGVGDEVRTIARQALATRALVEGGLVRDGAGRPWRYDLAVALPGTAAAGDGEDLDVALVLRADPARELLPRVAPTPGGVLQEAALFVRGAHDGGRGASAVVLAPGAPTPAASARLAARLAALTAPPPVAGRWLPSSGGAGRDQVLAVAVPGTRWGVMGVEDERSRLAAVGHRTAWIAVADVFALVAAALLLYGAWQRRALREAHRDRARQDETVRALRLLDAIANAATDAVTARDEAGRYLLANDEACRRLGRPREALIGRPVEEVIGCPDEAARERAWQDAVMRDGRVVESEGFVHAPDGARYLSFVRGPLRGGDGALTGVFEIAHDITARKREEDRMRQWSIAMASLREGVLVTDRDNRIVAVNPAFTAITGYEADDVLGRSPRILRSGRHDAAFYRAMWEALERDGQWQGEVWNRRLGGEVYPEWLSLNAVRGEDGQVTHYVGVFSDLSGLKRNEAQLERLAHYDALTELPNRRLLLQRLEQALSHAHRAGSRVAVLAIDLDDFKTLNDSLGHPVGDELLAAIARRLQSRLRTEDTLGRLGGDEFLVVVEDLRGAVDVGTLANDLLDAVSRPVQLAHGREVRVTASLGIALYPEDGACDAVEILRNADAALYRAKDAGRNCFSFYTADLNAGAVARLELEASLGRAIERRELVLHYQPKVDAAGGGLVGAEALLRWVRSGGIVPPGDFIPLVEQGTLIFEIGGWVIDAACAQIRAWLDQGLDVVPIAVNVAARQFSAGDLDTVVGSALQRHRVPAELLEIELTETTLLQHGTETMLLLHRLKALGVRLSLDDFGTGYSSLAYLQSFPIDELKIDRSFVQDIGQGPDGAAIVDAVVALAHRLHLRVVAEGVETESQEAYLRRQGCDVLQGYRFGRPAPADVLAARLRERPAEPAFDNVVPLRAS